MIRLEVEKYCENCGKFKPCVVVEGCHMLGYNAEFNTTVICKHADQCRALMEHLKRCNAE